MQTVNANQEYKEGVFVQELKNRFLCEVLIDGALTVCYVPSSCRLGNFLSLAGKRVLLIPTKDKKARTSYSLFAIPYKHSYVLLNPSMANVAVLKSIRGRRFSFLGDRQDVRREHIVKGYKTDLFIEQTKTIIEVKSVIALGNTAVFPTVYSERSQAQLTTIYNLLACGYKAALFIVSLNPYITSISVDPAAPLFQEIQQNVAAGMICKAFSCRLSDAGPIINREITLH